MNQAMRLLLTALLLSMTIHAQAASTASATIDISTLTVSSPGAFTFGHVPGTFFDNSANANDLIVVDSESVNFGDASAMVNADTWATGTFDGTLLESSASASVFSATASSRYYEAYTITYDSDFGGTITVEVDYTMSGSDPFMANPSAPFADVFTNVQLDIWAFDPIPSVSPYNDGDVIVGLAFFGAPLADAGTLVAEIEIPDFDAGTVLILATESSIQVNAVGLVPIPPAVALFASAVGLLGLRRRR